MGISYKELLAMETSDQPQKAKKGKKTLGKRAKPKDQDVMIVMKDKDGKVINFEEDDEEENDEIEANQEQNEEKENVKEKKKKSKPTKKKIQSEETLEMLKQVMGNNKKENSMAMIEEEGDEKDLMNSTSLSFFVQADKKGKKGKKAKKKKKEAIDTQTRFFNSHSENPKLQLIENSYLKFLEAQHAKESHLKAIKKF